MTRELDPLPDTSDRGEDSNVKTLLAVLSFLTSHVDYKRDSLNMSITNSVSGYLKERKEQKQLKDEVLEACSRSPSIAGRIRNDRRYQMLGASTHTITQEEFSITIKVFLWKSEPTHPASSLSPYL